MSLSYRDVGMVNDSLNNLGDTLFKNRVMQQQQAQQQLENQRQRQQDLSEADYRQVQQSLEQKRIAAEAANYQSEADYRKAEAARAGKTANAKGSKVFYFVSPNTRNVMSFAGTPEDAQAQFAKIQASKPGEQFVLTDKEPDTIKDLNEIPIDDQHTLHVSDADAAKYFMEKMKATKPPAAAAGKQEVRQVLNPAHVVGGVVDTNQPSYLSLTNTTTPLNIGDSGLPNLAPAASPAAAVKPTPADVSYLAAHPEMKAKFEARFGAGSADQYLP